MSDNFAAMLIGALLYIAGSLHKDNFISCTLLYVCGVAFFLLGASLSP